MSELLATLWLDADRNTYETLCTGGAATVTVLSSASHRARTPKHDEEHPRRGRAPLELRPRDNAASEEVKGGTESSPCLDRGDADARLDVLEEVQLCNVVPVLPRTFATADLVQQLVPCTHFFASSCAAAAVAAPAIRSDGDEYQRTCLAHVRRAADAHVRRLRTAVRATHIGLPTHPPPAAAHAALCGADGEGVALPPPLPPYMTVAPAADTGSSESINHSSGAPEVDEAAEAGSGFSSGVEQHDVVEISCGSPWAESSAAPPHSPSVLSILADHQDGAGSSGSPAERRDARHEARTATRTLILPMAEPSVPASTTTVDAEGAQRSGREAAPGAPGTARAASHGVLLTHREPCDRAVPPPPTPCTTFAAAQTRYLLFREAQLQQRRQRPLHTPRGSARVPEVLQHHEVSAVEGALSEDMTHFQRDKADAPLAATEAFWATAPASCLAPDPATLTTPHATAPGVQSFAACCAAGRNNNDLLHDGVPGEGEDEEEEESSSDDVDTGAAADALALSNGLLAASLSALPPTAPPPPTHGTTSAAAAAAAPVGIIVASALPQQQGGAVVEWAAGTVSYTADTLGLFEEQQLRAERFYHLPPPHPEGCAVHQHQDERPASASQGSRRDLNRAGGEEASAGGAEDRTSLRGAVLAQLHRLRRARGAGCRYVAAAAAASRARMTLPQGSLSKPQGNNVETAQTTASGSEKADTNEVTCAASAAAAAAAWRSRRRCPCFRCSPLLFQFAQVPSMPSHVVRWYLDVLHRTALPGLAHPASSALLPASLFPPPTSPAADAPGVPAAPCSDSAAALAAPPTAASARPRRGRPAKRLREDAGSAGREEASAAASPAGLASGTAASHGAVQHSTSTRPRGDRDPLEVFPGLPQWLAQERVRASPDVRPPQHEHSERVSAAVNCARSEQTAEAPAEPQHDVSFSEPSAPPAAAPPAAAAAAATPSLRWVDDAVLDEAVIVGVVPRGRPHELRLVCPSRAFCMELVQELEAAAEAATWVLTFFTPPPSSALASCAGELAEANNSHRTLDGSRIGNSCSGGISNDDKDDSDNAWHEWLRRQYFTVLWAALHTRLTHREWRLVVQAARDSPWLAEEAPRGVTEDLSPSMEAQADAVCEAALAEVRASVQAAAVAHVDAVVSASEDLVSRVVITALVPVLHRRIRVLYELLRHLASKSLYASHRLQCEAYWNWYTTTPSPGAVLRLLQRSHRFARALARCYPQYCGTDTDSSLHAHSSVGAGDGEGEAERRLRPAVGAASELTSHLTAADTATAQAPDGPSSPPTTTTSSGAAGGNASGVAIASAWATPAVSLGDEGPLPTRAASAAAASPSPPPLSNSPSPSLSPPPPTTRTSVTHVPESALLDPCYLQRFALWKHRMHHGGGPGSAAAAAAAAAASAAAFDYLREVPVAEQDAALRTVLRSFAQKGRTLEWEEVRRHVDSRHQTSYVYH